MSSIEGKNISTFKLGIFFLICSLLIFLIISDDNNGYISIIDDANLLFHEAGHLIFGLFGDTMGLYGGTLGQLAIPIICGIAFLRQESLFSVSVVSLWFFENFFNIARYMADARSRMLPLVGGGEHDWTNILTRWGVLQYDTTLATILRIMGWTGLFLTLLWISYLWWQDKKTYTNS